MSIVFRYVLVDGSPIERFWSFYNPSGHNDQLLFECVKSALQGILSNTKNFKIPTIFTITNKYKLLQQFTSI